MRRRFILNSSPPVTILRQPTKAEGLWGVSVAKGIEAGRDTNHGKEILEENLAETALEIYRKPMLVRHSDHVALLPGQPVISVVH